MIFLILQVQANLHAALSLKSLIISAKNKPSFLLNLYVLQFHTVNMCRLNGQGGLVHHVILTVPEFSNLLW